MDELDPNDETEEIEEVQLDPFPAAWVLILGGIATGLSIAAWLSFVIGFLGGPVSGGYCAAGAMVLGFIALNISKRNSLMTRLPAFVGTGLGLIFLANLIVYFVFGMILFFMGDLPAPPSPG